MDQTQNDPLRFLVAGRKDHDLDGFTVRGALVRDPSNRGTRRAQFSIDMIRQKIKCSMQTLYDATANRSERLIQSHVYGNASKQRQQQQKRPR